jgi:diacylglycerol kinase family enzyme
VRALMVHNPTAGGGRAGRLVPAVLARLRDAGVEVEQHRTRSLEDGRVAACQAATAFDAVVAVGGDGTVGACAAGLLPRLQRRPADLATVAGRAYLNVAGAGFDSEVNRVANQRLGWAKGRPRYVGAVLAELVVGRRASFELVLDDQASRHRGWLVAVANGPSYGGGMRVAPAASLQDGLLDVVVIHDIGKLEFLKTFPKVFSGRHVEHPAVSVHRAGRVELDADRPLAVYADGEPSGTLPATFQVRRAAITVLAADDAPGFPGR